ncbi:O-antigen ligase family protein [Desulfogranum marinum]|uniref:O-antigen ligase family protein n=1 Tax=Desulfogranum marinum TaxID=453220 RepID=UPI001962EC48|nr:O-antigen ligase family protein [Desulfogranum marinum]MBM9514810.1 O-antigen ligase family protein [Desulfogranum marinum]
MENKNLLFKGKASAPFTRQSGWGHLFFLFLAVLMAFGNLFFINLLDKFTTFSYMKFGALLLVACCVFYLLSKPDIFVSTRLAIFSLIPIINFSLPPKRFDFKIFTVLLVICFLVLFIRVLMKKKTINLIPDKLAFFFLLSALPPVFFGFDSLNSIEHFVKVLMLDYLFFIILYGFLSEKDAFYDIVKYLALALIFISLGIFFEFITGINLSGDGKNFNALRGFTRCAGFFQDPQKAAQFLAVGITFFTLLLCRNVPLGKTGSRLVSVSLFVSFIALFLTASKNGIITAAFMSTFAVIFFNKNSTLRSAFLFFVVPLSLFMLLVFQGPITSMVLESSAGARMTGIVQSANTRVNIWHESWLAFQNYGNVVTGVGPGNYQEMTMRADPLLRNKHEAKTEYVLNHPESGYLKIFYETGLFSLMGLFLFLLGIMYKTAKSFFASRQTVSTSIAVSASFALVAFSFGFVTQFTVTDNRNLMIFVIMYALLSYLQKNNFSLDGYDE